jgi:hypothetical protein
VRVFETKARVLLIVSQAAVDRARVVAGKAMTELRMPVSLQIVLRALIEEGLKCPSAALLANMERQARAVRHSRSVARQRTRAGIAPRSGRGARLSARSRQEKGNKGYQ